MIPSNGLAHAIDFVAGQIVHDDDVAGAQAGGEDLLGVGLEGDAVHRPVEQVLATIERFCLANLCIAEAQQQIMETSESGY